MTVIHKCNLVGQCNNSSGGDSLWLLESIQLVFSCVSFGIITSRVSISQMLLLFKHMGLSAVSPWTYFLHQNDFIIVIMEYFLHQTILLNLLNRSGVSGSLEPFLADRRSLS